MRSAASRPPPGPTEAQWVSAAPPPAKKNRPIRFSPKVLAVLGVLSLLAFILVFHSTLLRAGAAFLDVGEDPVPSDIIFLLGGDLATRAPHAAELYRDRLAPRILLVRAVENAATELGVFPNETDATRELLLRLGVPDSAIVMRVWGVGVNSTTEEAMALRDYLREAPADHVLIVTSDYHTRRTRWNFRRQLKGADIELHIYGAPDTRFTWRDWWRTEQGTLVYMQEYLKFAHNWLYR